jgi:hypothetical protein
LVRLRRQSGRDLAPSGRIDRWQRPRRRLHLERFGKQRWIRVGLHFEWLRKHQQCIRIRWILFERLGKQRQCIRVGRLHLERLRKQQRFRVG